MDRKRLLKTLSGIYGFYEKELTEFSVRVWEQSLADRDADEIDAAFTAHIRNPDSGRWLPKPADIIRFLEGDSEEQALIAWGHVLSAARSGGANFNGPIQQALDSLGGMGRLRLASESENGFLQRQFVSAFKAYKARTEDEPLLGMEEVKRLA